MRESEKQSHGILLESCAHRAVELYSEDRWCENGGKARSDLKLEFGKEIVSEMLEKGIENNFSSNGERTREP